ncbi:MAG: HAMP domain-containing protein, partial [Terracidiphilus sp.]
MTSKVITKLLGLFVLLLILQTAVMALVFRHPLGYAALWSGLIALALVLPVAAWADRRAGARLQRVISFARQIGAGDLSARLGLAGGDELTSIEAALNQSAERLGESFAEIE